MGRTNRRIAGALLLLAGVPAAGGTAVPRTLEQTVRAAEWIVDVEVLSVRTDPEIPFPGVWSRVELRVLEQVAGAALPSVVDLFAPGGRIGDEIRIAVGAPVFEQGDRYVLLLRSWEGAAIVLENLVQSAFPVRTGAAGAEWIDNDLARRGIVSTVTTQTSEPFERRAFVDLLREARGR